MTKQEAIQRFKDACVNPNNYYKRKNAIMSQYNRNTWELHNNNHELIRIENVIGIPKIIIFNSQFTSTIELHQQEYEELKTLYFGNFQEDIEYLKRTRAI